MYPFMRMLKELAVHRRAPGLPMTGTHVSQHRVWPQDLDFLMELNNGRTLTLYDLGRIPLARRTGLLDVVRNQGWGMTVAGSSVRYRRRVTLFQKVRMLSRGVGWDDRFLYLDQSMWRADGECCSQALLRMAITGPDGIVPPRRAIERMGQPPDSPPLPDWVRAWSSAESQRPWPPERNDTKDHAKRQV